MALVAEQGEDPPVLFGREHPDALWVAGRGADDEPGSCPPGRPAQPQRLAGVPDIHLHPLFGGRGRSRATAARRECGRSGRSRQRPGRRAASPRYRGVAPRQGRRWMRTPVTRSGAAAARPAASHPSVISTLGGARTLVCTCAFQVGPGGLHETPAPRPPSVHGMAAEGCPRLGKFADHRGSPSHEVRDQPGEQLIDGPGPAGQQRVNVPPLGARRGGFGARRQAVPVGDRHLFVRVSQYPRRQQAPDARPGDYCVVTDLRHLDPRIVPRPLPSRQ